MATLKDVAREAQVSVTTVSRWLNGYLTVREETEKRIQEAIRSLGYRPNMVARSMVLQKSNMVALIVPDITTPFFAEIAKGVQQVAETAGYSVLLGDTGEDPGREKQYIEALESRYVDGYILAGTSISAKRHSVVPLRDEFDHLRGKMVLINRNQQDAGISEIYHDSKTAVALVTQYLLSLGHSRIGFITGPPDITGTQLAVEGFLDTMGKASLSQSTAVVEGDLKLQGGEKATEELFLLLPNLTAVVVFSELMAAGALNVLRMRNLNVPNDVSLVTLDETFLSSVIYPRLTCATFNARVSGCKAMQLLLKHMKSPEMSSERVIIPPHIVKRDSTTCARMG